MTQFVYGGQKTVLALGMGMMGGEATPFIGFVPRDPNMKGSVLVSGSKNTDDTIKEIEAKGGVIIWFDNPDAAERIHTLLANLFDTACSGEWGDKNEVMAKC